MDNTHIKARVFHSPLGPLMVGATDQGICLCDWIDLTSHKLTEVQLTDMTDTPAEQAIHAACKQLREYFAGQRTRFDLPLAPIGTDFQLKVWRELTSIPYGLTISYAQLAQQIGNPKAVRAVAQANASNLISILLPCHRVIGANGSLTGYSGGLERKRALLALERRVKEGGYPCPR